VLGRTDRSRHEARAGHPTSDPKPCPYGSGSSPKSHSVGVANARAADTAAATGKHLAGASPAAQCGTAERTRKQARTGPAKLFVLDTNVLLHDPMCLFRFEEHDIYLPMIVLEELDGHKKGMTEVARNARQTSRDPGRCWLPTPGARHDRRACLLNATGPPRCRRQAVLPDPTARTYTLPTSLPQGKADNQILGVVRGAAQHRTRPREVVLVSKDINMRVKARALGLATEDYQNDKTLEDGDLLYSGALALPADFWDHARPQPWRAGSKGSTPSTRIRRASWSQHC